MTKNVETILKYVAFGAFVIGGVTIGTAVAQRVKRMKDEEETDEAVVEAEAIAENFSGVMGRKTPVRSFASPGYNTGR